MELTVRVPGSCGELVQGWLRGEPFLVTCPIDRYTRVRVSGELQGLRGFGEKARRALELTLNTLGQGTFPWGMELTSELPRGKGMGSSSADIAAVVAAASASLGRSFSPEEILHIAVQIEPTDATFFPGVVALNQVTGRVFRRYGELPSLPLALFDTGGCVDTVSFHAEEMRRSGERARHDWGRLLWHLTENVQSLAAATTLSACWNEEILPKRHFAAIRAAVHRSDALGMIAAHSGTVIGVILPQQDEAAAAERLRVMLPDLAYLGRSRLISGGISLTGSIG